MQIETTNASGDDRATTTCILRPLPGTGPGANPMRIAKIPELGKTTGEHAAARIGLTPIAHDRGPMRSKRAIGGGRRALRHGVFMAPLVARDHNPVLRTFTNRHCERGRAHTPGITALARKPVTIAHALRRAHHPRTRQRA
ncbi:transposase [Cognatishimia sp. F0-27]|uniref:transposase n=1 Tax=Cognatishimia sp. F0-27 TaxID=2816855 RepID=UPI001D0C5E82